MTLAELRERPTMLVVGGKNGQRIHESCFRSYGMLDKVRSLLRSPTQVPASVILEMIDDVMEAPYVAQDATSVE